jgi:hypothetical protein
LRDIIAEIQASVGIERGGGEGDALARDWCWAG